MNVIPFRSLPQGARRLIIYYAIGEPSVVGMLIFNAYLFLSGYSPLYVGSIISGAALITALLFPIFGYLSDKKINAKYFSITFEGLMGASFLLYGFAQDGLWMFIGRVFFSSAMMFSFVSSVYERELYPEEHMDDVYVWHWIIPSVGGMIVYIASFLYFQIFQTVYAARWYYIFLGLIAPGYMAYVYFALPDLPVYKKREKLKIPLNLIGVVLVYLFANFTTYFLYGITVDNIVINYFGTGLSVVVFLALIDSVFSFSSGVIKAHVPRKYFSVMPYLAMSSIAIFSLILFISGSTGVKSLPLFLVIYAVIGFMWPLWHMSFKPLLLLRVPRQYRGTVFSSISSLTRIVNVPLAFLIGLTISSFGSFFPVLLASVFALGTVLLLKKVVGRGISPSQHP